MKRVFIIGLIFIMGSAFPVFAHEPAVPILLYHNVTYGYSTEDASLHITPEEFDSQLTALKAGGYNIISLKQYADYVSGNATLPDKPVIITFDDGYSGVYNHAYPILLRHNIPATVFIITGLVGYNDTIYPHFTWEQAAEMDKSDVIDIQSHTRFHYNAEEISLPLLVLELRKSKFDIETRLNKKCEFLAFPYGAYDGDGLEAALAAGFTCIARTEDRGTNRKSDGIHHLNRIFVHGTWSGEELIRIIEENNQLYID